MRKAFVLLGMLACGASSWAQSSVYVMQKKQTEMTAVVPSVEKIDYSQGFADMYSGNTMLRRFDVNDVLSMGLSERDTLRSVLMPEQYRGDFDFEIAFSAADHKWTGAVEITDEENPWYDDFVNHSTWDKEIMIAYGGGKAQVTGEAEGVEIEVKDNHVVVRSATSGVAYTLKGKTEDGSFKLYSEKKAKLILDGVELHNPKGPAINSQGKKRLFICTTKGTVSKLSDGAKYDKVSGEDQRGCIFAEGRICLNGEGELYVTGNKKSAIASDDYVHMLSGFVSASVNASKGKTVYAKDNVIVGGGSLQAYAGGEAGKGIASDSLIYIYGGLVKAITVGDAIYEDDKEDYTSACAIKCEYDMTLTGGDIFAMSTGTGGKGISVGNSVENESGKTTYFGTLTQDGARVWVRTAGARIPEVKVEDVHGEKVGAAASPKGVKVANNVTFNSGEMYVRCSGGYAAEGIESKKVINMNGGKVRSYCVDDGLNGEGIYVKGGDLFVCSTANDGMDVSFLGMTDGTVYSIGAAVEQMGVDTDGKTFYINGGDFTAVASNNCNPFASVSKQPSVTVFLRHGVRYVQLVDAQGTAVKTVQTPNYYIGWVNENNKVGKNISVLIGCEGIKMNEQYRVLSYATSLNDEPVVEYEFTAEKVHTTLGSYNKY